MSTKKTIQTLCNFYRFDGGEALQLYTGAKLKANVKFIRTVFKRNDIRLADIWGIGFDQLYKKVSSVKSSQPDVIPLRSSIALHFSPVMRILDTILKGYPYHHTFGVSGTRTFSKGAAGNCLMAVVPQMVPLLLEAFMHKLVGPLGADRMDFQRDVLSRPQVSGGDDFGPVFIIGIPRSGTTVLQKLLAMDPDARTPLNYEYETPGSYISLKDRLRKAAEVHAENAGGHRYEETGPEEPAEDYNLFMKIGAPPNFAPQPDQLTGYHEASEWYMKERNMVDMFCMHRMTARLLEKQFPDTLFKHWIFKDPSHIRNSLPAIVKVYPNARFVWIHRDLEECLASQTVCCSHDAESMFLELAECLKAGMHFRKTGPYVASSCSVIKTQDFRFTDIMFSDLIDKPVEAIEGVYQSWEKTMSEEHKRAISEWSNSNTREPKKYRSNTAIRKAIINNAKRLEDYLKIFSGASKNMKVHPNGKISFNPNEGNGVDEDDDEINNDRLLGGVRTGPQLVTFDPKDPDALRAVFDKLGIESDTKPITFDPRNKDELQAMFDKLDIK